MSDRRDLPLGGEVELVVGDGREESGENGAVSADIPHAARGDGRLDKYISDCFGGRISRTAAARLIEAGNVSLNGNHAGKSAQVSAGDRIVIRFPDPEPDRAVPENIPLDIVYEDNELLVVNKPKGMVVHPAPGNYSGTLVNALLYHCGDSLSGIGGVLRPGIVHRIDKDTSGLLIIAKNDSAHRFLSDQIRVHSFTREYEAVVRGTFDTVKGTVNAPIGRNPNDRKKMAVTQSNSKPAVTHYSLLRQFDKFAHLRLALETGRTHQIRVHMAYIHHAVANDAVYGAAEPMCDFSGQCLHAKKIGFVHPNGKYLEFESNLPAYFADFLSKLDRGARR